MWRGHQFLLMGDRILDSYSHFGISLQIPKKGQFPGRIRSSTGFKSLARQLTRESLPSKMIIQRVGWIFYLLLLDLSCSYAHQRKHYYFHLTSFQNWMPNVLSGDKKWATNISEIFNCCCLPRIHRRGCEIESDTRKSQPDGCLPVHRF